MSLKPWNYDRLMREAYKRPNFDFSFVHPLQVNGGESQIPIRCRVCGYDRYAPVNDIFNGKGNCIRCSKRLPWNLLRLLTEGVQRWPTTNFSRVREEEIGKSTSRITVGCYVCGEWWETTINSLVNGYGCLVCRKSKPWNLYRLLLEGPRRWPTVNFSRVHESGNISSRTPINVGCYMCGEWRIIKISYLVSGKNCRTCMGKKSWSLHRLLTEGVQRWPTVNFSQLREEDVVNSGTHIKVGCYVCGYWRNMTIDALVAGNGCAMCSGCGPWTYERFLSQKDERPDIDFSLVTPDQFRCGSMSRITCKCKTCFTVWAKSPSAIFTSKGSCPTCNASIGERIINEILTEAIIPYKREFILPSLPKKRFDFVFRYNERNFLVEFDGGQHFNYEEFFHRNEETFLEKQKVDVLKSHHAYINGYFLIRIDHTNLNNIRFHMNEAVSLAMTTDQKYYLSSPEMYSYLFTTPRAES